MVFSILTHYAIGLPTSLRGLWWPVFFTTGRNTQPDMRPVECALQKGR